MNKRLIILSIIIAGCLRVAGQVPSGYLCSLRNDSLLTSKIYEFDIYLLNTDNSVNFELGVFQAGISLNSSIVNGGTITPTIVSGTSELTTAQQPANIKFESTQNSVKLAAKSPPGYGNGTTIIRTGYGKRICRIRLTNSADFGQANPDLAFTFSPIPYNTVVAAYNVSTHLNTVVTSQGNHSTTSLANPKLNGPVLAFNVTGSGAYCQGSGGLTVTLNGSQTNIRYQLKKNGASDGGEVAGDGNAINWYNKAAGTYKVIGRRPSTYMTKTMTDSALIIINTPTIAGSVTGGSTIYLGSSTDTLRLTGQTGSIMIWQKRLNGGGYSDISATSGRTTYIEIPTAAGTWDYRTIVKNGVCSEDFSSPATVIVTLQAVTRSWIGTINENWDVPGNWSPYGVPAEVDDVVIPSTAPYMPVVESDGNSCNNIIVLEGATLTVTPGFIITVNGTIDLTQ